jgi:hypothetical protein
MNYRVFFYKILSELIPAPTLRRLAFLKKIILSPRVYFFKIADRIVRLTVSPLTYSRIKIWAVERFSRRRDLVSPIQGLPNISIDKKVEDSGLDTAICTRASAAVTKVYFGGRRYGSLEELVSSHGHLKADCVVACAFLGRYEVLDLMVSEATSMPDGYRTIVCLVGSTDEDGDFLEKLTAQNPLVVGFLTDNSPVGRKWQYAVDGARFLIDFDLLAIAGSDDIIPIGTLTGIIDRHRLCMSDESIAPYATSLYGTMEWLILSESNKDIISPQLVKCNYRLGLAIMPLGAGRFYSRQIMDYFEGDIFDVSKNRHLDDKGFYKVRDGGFGVEYLNVTQGAILSVKGNWAQMNAFDDILKAPDCEVTEFSFEGYAILKKQMTQATFSRLFGPKKR